MTAYRAESTSNGNLKRLDKFLEEFLYSPFSGYYTAYENQEKDYLTAPQFSDLFSDFVSEFMVLKAEEDQVTKPIFADLGGGTGKIAISLLKKAESSRKFILSDIYLIEKSFKRASRALRESPSITHIDDISKLPARRPVYAIANEFFDAFPPRVFKIKNGEIYEAYLKYENNKKFIEYQKTTHLSKFIKEALSEVRLYGEEGIVEIQESACRFIRTLKRFKRFSLLLFDYGYEFSEIERFPEGTLASYRNYNFLESFLELEKPADITCHVNFSFLKRWLSESGFEIVFYENQGRWLIENGFLEFFKKKASSMNHEMLRKELSGFKKIVLPGHMGDVYKVLFAIRNSRP